MSSIIQHISIPKSVATEDDLDFYFLREKGIQYIEELGGVLWTDFNSHDPGITMLEMLCYAITDLGNRIETPIQNLLASKDPSKGFAEQFYKSEEIFPNKPVTALDYRKIFIDIDGVRNCWLRTFDKKVHVNCRKNELTYNPNKYNNIETDFKDDFNLRGLYTLLVEFEDIKTQSKVEKIEKIKAIKEEIKIKYHQNRNLCEDLVEITKVKTKPISVCASIEVENEANEEEVHANVLFEIRNYLSPTVSFHSLKEMLSRGYITDYIFDGPLLDNGFIDTEELEKAELRSEVRLSDLMKIIMKIDGVKFIKDISISNCESGEELENPWVIYIKGDKKPVLCDKSAVSYHKGVLPLNINEKEVNRFLDELEEEAQEKKELSKIDRTLTLPEGRYSEIDNYNTVMNDFPDTYGIGLEGLNARATVERKAQAKQLKSYLLFFDKILASYFKQLSKVHDLLSISRSETKTFFSQALVNIKGIDELIQDYPSSDEGVTEMVYKAFDDDISRRNDIINHLLARFSESFGDYAFLMNMLYGKTAPEIALKNKQEFLKDYLSISAERGSAFNYYKQPAENLWDTNNISGFQKRASRLLGILNYNRRSLSNSFVEIYEVTNADMEVRFKWRVRNAQNAVVLSSSNDHASISRASSELYAAVLETIQTPEKEVEVLPSDIADDTYIQGIKINKSPGGKYSFGIINTNQPEGSPEQMIGHQYSFYNTIAELKEALLKTISFLKFEFTEEGMFLVEHILLRPDITDINAASSSFMPICADDCEDGCGLDPYSFKVSIILPGYTYRFANPDFRNYMENVIREELPAHIIPRICWIGDRQGQVPDDENDLLCFEQAYQDYLIAKTNLDQEQPMTDNEHTKLIKAMTKLNTIYPKGRLLDCSDESDEIEGRIILGQTNLGTLKTDNNGD